MACYLCAHRCTLAEGRARALPRPGQRGRAAMVSLVRDRLVGDPRGPHREEAPLPLPAGKPLLFGRHARAATSAASTARTGRSARHPRGRGGLGRRGDPGGRGPRRHARPGCRSIAYTYTEPTVFFETAEAVGVPAREAGLKNVFVTNGYLTPEAVAGLAPFLDAANVDLKVFATSRYRRVCGATLEGVLEGIAALLEAGVWVEVTTLVVPGLNDSEQELAAWPAGSPGSRRTSRGTFRASTPTTRWNGPGPTPVQSLERARDCGLQAGLHFVYLGNVPGHAAGSTACPSCGTMLVRRAGFASETLALAGRPLRQLRRRGAGIGEIGGPACPDQQSEENRMAFGSFRQDGEPVADINVTPLVDVMLVLLVIFMITTPLFERGIDVNLPQTVSSNISGAERVIVTIPKDKNYVYFNSQPVNRGS